MTPTVAITMSLANTMCESSPVEITQLKNVTDAADLLSDSENQSFCNRETECFMEEDVSEPEEVGRDLLKTLSETRSGSSTNICDEDEVLSVVEDNSAVISEGLLVVDAGSELSLSDTAMEIHWVGIVCFETLFSFSSLWIDMESLCKVVCSPSEIMEQETNGATGVESENAGAEKEEGAVITALLNYIKKL